MTPQGPFKSVLSVFMHRGFGHPSALLQIILQGWNPWRIITSYHILTVKPKSGNEEEIFRSLPINPIHDESSSQQIISAYFLWKRITDNSYYPDNSSSEAEYFWIYEKTMKQNMSSLGPNIQFVSLIKVNTSEPKHAVRAGSSLAPIQYGCAH